MTAREVWEKMRKLCAWGPASDGTCAPGDRLCAFDTCPLLKEAREKAPDELQWDRVLARSLRLGDEYESKV
ncbi:MAG: hypothetical protein PHF64_00100 [Methanoregula sp.]|nr:hypothetical protein [Methanoregula sp.]